MYIRFKCLKCNQKIKVPKEAIGKRCKCSACNNISRIPSDPSEWLPPSDQVTQERPLRLQGKSVVRAAGVQHIPCPHCGQVISTPKTLAGKKILCPHCDQQVGIPKGTLSKPIDAHEDICNGDSQVTERFSVNWCLKFVLPWVVFIVLSLGIMSLYDAVGSALFNLVSSKSTHSVTFENLKVVYDDESSEELLLRTVKILQKKLPQTAYSRSEIADFEECMRVFEDRLNKAEINYNAKRIGDKILWTSGGIVGCWEEADAGNASFGLGAMIAVGEGRLKDEINEFETALK